MVPFIPQFTIVFPALSEVFIVIVRLDEKIDFVDEFYVAIHELICTVGCYLSKALIAATRQGSL
jgi:hypothetical protein